jgi:hypothetical protein
VHFAGFAPAFTLSLCDSEYTRKPPVPIASVVMPHAKVIKNIIINNFFYSYLNRHDASVDR